MKQTTSDPVVFLNTAALFGSALLVGMAFSMQILLAELPCALCNLQRLEFLLFGSGLFIVLLYPERYGSGYLVSGISAIVGACTAITQVFIHILPTDEGGVGSPVLGFHLYAWCFVLFILAIAYVLTLQSVHKPSVVEAVGGTGWQRFRRQPRMIKTTIAFYIFIAIVASSSAFVANGFGPFLEGGQQKYWLIEVIKQPGTEITKDVLMGR